MMGVGVPRRSAVLAAALTVAAVVAITAVTYYRSWSQEQLAAGGWPRPEGGQLGLLSPSVPTGPELARELYGYIETPSSWCRRLTLFGGACGAAGIVTGVSFVCLDDAYAPQPGSCLIYSFGVAREWSFAADAARHGCEVHVLDPTMATAPDGKTAFGVKFHQVGLGGGAGRTDPSTTVKTLTEVMAKLGPADRLIDFLRVDVEGSEWRWLEGDLESLANVRQLGLKIHMSLDSLARYYRVLQRIHQLGFRVIYSAPDRASGRDWDVEGVRGKVGAVYEIVWVNRRRCVGTFGCGN